MNHFFKIKCFKWSDDEMLLAWAKHPEGTKRIYTPAFGKFAPQACLFFSVIFKAILVASSPTSEPKISALGYKKGLLLQTKNQPPNQNKTSNLIIFNRDGWNDFFLRSKVLKRNSSSYPNYIILWWFPQLSLLFSGSMRTLFTPDSNVMFDMKHLHWATPFIIHTPPVEDFGKV